MSSFVSRAGEKLQFALSHFNISVKDKVIADFGSSAGGFVDCLLQNGAKKVFAVETGYGVLDYKFRKDSRVVVMERTNAMHVNLSENVDFVTIDTSWTKQKNILPNAFANLKEGGKIISLIKPHYEADPKFLRKGRLVDEKVGEVLEKVRRDIEVVGGKVVEMVESPITGEKGKNREFLVLIAR